MPSLQRCWLVDDSPTVRQVLSALLNELAPTWQVLDFSNATDLLAQLESSAAPDFILIDLNMGGMDGIELARLAAERHPGLRIMFITGFAAVALKAEETAPPGARVLSKPVHLRDLVDEVDRMLAA